MRKSLASAELTRDRHVHATIRRMRAQTRQPKGTSNFWVLNELIQYWDISSFLANRHDF